ncbi:MAG: shikimate dehydrogenase [Bacteroidales bacterium]
MQAVYGLIGHPLGHSFSKEYFSQKFKDLGLESTCCYDLFPLSAIEDFPQLLDTETNLKGLNVTIPYKTSVLQYVHAVDVSVQEIGAANVLKIDANKRIYAYNTDCIGFEKTFVPLLQVYHTKALIFGSGGAALAVAYILRKYNIEYTFVSRTSITTQSIRYDQVDAYIRKGYTVLINATPLGMFPQIDIGVPIDYRQINAKFLCYDLVYNPRMTKFLRLSQAQGATIKDGLDMLHFQADAAWEIWNRK